MAKFYCKRDCFFNGRLWKKGEEIEAQSADSLPRHFGEKQVFSAPKMHDDPSRRKSRDFVDYVTNNPREDLVDDDDDPRAIKKPTLNQVVNSLKK